MNRRHVGFLSIVALLAAAFLGWKLADPEARESRRIQKRLSALAREISFPENESAVRKLTYADRVGAYFADPTDFSIALGPRSIEGIHSRAQLEEGCRGIRAVSRGLEVSFLDITPTLQPDRQRATAHLTSKIYFKGDPDYWIQEFRLHLAHSEHQWRITRIETVRTMRR